MWPAGNSWCRFECSIDLTIGAKRAKETLGAEGAFRWISLLGKP
jgi:hypothetical protein